MSNFPWLTTKRASKKQVDKVAAQLRSVYEEQVDRLEADLEKAHNKIVSYGDDNDRLQEVAKQQRDSYEKRIDGLLVICKEHRTAQGVFEGKIAELQKGNKASRDLSTRQIVEMSAENNKLQAKIKGQNAHIAKLEAENTSLHEAISGKDKAFSDLQESVREKDRILDSLTSSLGTSTKLLDEAQANYVEELPDMLVDAYKEVKN